MHSVISGLLVITLAMPSTTAAPRRTDETEADTRVSAAERVEPVPVRPFTPQPPKADPEAPAPRRTAKVSWPVAGRAQVAVSKVRRTRAGGLPVWVEDAGDADTPSRVEVRTTGPAAGGRLPFTVRRTDGVASSGRVRIIVDYSGFADAFGGDWSARLRIMPLRRTDGVVASRNDMRAKTVSAEVAVGNQFVVTAPPQGSTGDFKATSLSPSGNWQVSTQGGEFSWSYPLRTPPVPGELVPDLALSYSSGTVDGRTVATNSQPSWAGEGWNLWPGFIERSYKGCADDLGGNNGTTKSGDLCWETDNATLSFGNHSGRLVRSGTGPVWRLEDDDGTRVELLTGATNGDNTPIDPVKGEHWKVTTTDGTRYFFGRRMDSAWTVPVFGNDTNEPCRQTTFDASECNQPYRWNLDYVVDPHGNSMSYLYREETNRYGANSGRRGVEYTQAGTLERVEYGTRDGVAGQAPARVWFDVGDRCLSNCGVHDANTWPDVPWNQLCTSGLCADKTSPTFWSTKRLTRITAQVSTAGGTYRNVDQWTLAHSFPPPGDGTTGALWLNSISHTGLAAAPSVTLPAVTFDGTMKPNRVNSAPDGLPALNKMRITTITSESGGDVNVVYQTPDCTPTSLPRPDTNTKLCFPARWAMPPAPEPDDDWFHKYVVAQTTEHDKVTDAKAVVTNYDYLGGGAWAFDDDPLIQPAKRTWSQWRGFGRVVVRKGDPAQDEHHAESRSSFLYFRGMHGEPLAGGGTRPPVNVVDSTGKELLDSRAHAGFTREEIVYNGAGELRGTIMDPLARQTGSHLNLRSNQVETVRTVTRDRLSGGGVRTTQIDMTYDEYGNPTQVNDLADVNTPADDRCTTRTYALNTATMLVSLPSRETVVGVACGTPPVYPSDAISDTLTWYDDLAHGAAPVKGDATRVDVAKSYSGSTPSYLTTVTTIYDSYGRVLKTKDALQRPTATNYTDVNGLNTAVETTNALLHVSTSTLDPARGHPLKEKDPNGRITSLKYDALGRLFRVWKPGRVELNGDSPHFQFDYGVRNSGGPNWVRTLTLKPNGNQVATYTLLDGFLRERQTQAPSPTPGGRIITDTLYDSRGLAVVRRAPMYDETALPGTVLQTVTDGGKVPSATVTVYDGAERKIHEIYAQKNIEQWRTTTIYGGTNVTVIPPKGGTMKTTWTDARDRVVALVQYHSRDLTGTSDVTRYGYTKRGDLTKVIDAAGNVWRYSYDVLGRKTVAEDPDQGTSTMDYDDAGQLVSVTDARGKEVTIDYDDLGRKTGTELGSTPLTEFVYDSPEKGTLKSAIRYAGGHAYTRTVDDWDVAGRPKGETVTIPAVENGVAGTYSTTYTYLADGSPLATTLPKLGDPAAGGLAQETLTRGYDELGQPDALTGAQKYVTDTRYTELGELFQQVLGAAGKELWRTSVYEFGTRRLKQLLTTSLAPDGAWVHDFNYGYDEVGNVTSIADRTAGSARDVQCFQYDYLRRTTEAWTQVTDCAATPSASVIGGPAPYWQKFGYDSSGNRTSHTRKGFGGASDAVSTYTYPAPGDGVDQPHAVTSVTTGASTASYDYDYDDAGHTAHRTGQTLTWDDEGLLASISTGTGTTSYVYDADGNQLIRRDPGGTTLFVGGGELTVDTATGAKRATRYYDGIGARTSAGFVWALADHHGTSQIAVDPGTLKPAARRFDPFGNPRGGAVAWPAGDRGFVGGSANAATGLTRLGAREYDPSLGKFVSVDPVIDPLDPQQMNAYAYSNNNPATFDDPTGLFCDSCDFYASTKGEHSAWSESEHPKKSLRKGNRCSKSKCNTFRKQAEERKRKRALKQRELLNALKAKAKHGRLDPDDVSAWGLRGLREDEYGYKFEYLLGFWTTSTAEQVFNRIKDDMFWFFPIPGMCDDLKAGRTCSLAGNPVKIKEVGSRHFELVSLPGHVEGAGKHIRFTIKEGAWASIMLEVEAWGPADKPWQTNGVGAWVNDNVVANSLWAAMAWNISFVTW